LPRKIIEHLSVEPKGTSMVSDMKGVFFNFKSFYIIGYCLELIIKIWQFGGFFFPSKSAKFAPFSTWKILYIAQFHSCRDLAKMRKEKKTHWLA
jgi:hypothetical protein